MPPVFLFGVEGRIVVGWDLRGRTVWEYEDGDQMQCQECLTYMDEHFEEEQRGMYNWGDIICSDCAGLYTELHRKEW